MAPAASAVVGGGAHDLVGGVHVIEMEKNSYSMEVSSWIAAKKRPAGAATTSRHRSVESTELDLTTINDQLCNRRFIVKEVSMDTKASCLHLIIKSVDCLK